MTPKDTPPRLTAKAVEAIVRNLFAQRAAESQEEAAAHMACLQTVMRGGPWIELGGKEKARNDA